MMQRRILWMSGMADKILDTHEKNKKINLEELFPDMCLPANDDQEDFDVHEFNMHD